MSERTFNIYCDESCHLEHDGLSVMVWGAVICETKYAREISDKIRLLKRAHDLPVNFEIKWTKVSKSKVAFYEEAIDLFLSDDRLRFRGLLVPDKTVIDHRRFDQTHDQWYYKMYFTMLRYIIVAPHHYRIYLDIKDTRGADKAEKLHDVLANSIYDFSRTHIERVQQIRSHESEILQLSDLLIGAIGYANRKLTGNEGKVALVEHMKRRRGPGVLQQTSSFGSPKFNLLVWASNEGVASAEA